MINIVLLIIIILIIFSLIYLVNNRCSNSCVEKWSEDCKTCLAGKNILKPCDSDNDCECDDDDTYCKNYSELHNGRDICWDLARTEGSTYPDKFCKYGTNAALPCTNENDCPCDDGDSSCNNTEESKCVYLHIDNGCLGTQPY